MIDTIRIYKAIFNSNDRFAESRGKHPLSAAGWSSIRHVTADHKISEHTRSPSMFCLVVQGLISSGLHGREYTVAMLVSIGDRLRVVLLNRSLFITSTEEGLPREQNILKGNPPRVIYHQVYLYTKMKNSPSLSFREETLRATRLRRNLEQKCR